MWENLENKIGDDFLRFFRFELSVHEIAVKSS